MPTVKRSQHGWTIVSRRRGQFITHQLSDEGSELLKARTANGQIDELGIDVRTLLELKRLGYAYIRGRERDERRRKRQWRKHEFDSPTLPFREPTPTPTPSPEPQLRCTNCGHTVLPAALFCPHCRHQLKSIPSTSTASHTGIYWVIAVIALLILILVLNRT